MDRAWIGLGSGLDRGMDRGVNAGMATKKTLGPCMNMLQFAEARCFKGLDRRFCKV